METTAIHLASLSAEPAAGTPDRFEAPPSGEFAKILRARPDQAESEDGKTEKEQGEERPATNGQEISTLLFSMVPAPMPEGQTPPGKNGPEDAPSGSPNPGNAVPPEKAAAAMPETKPQNESAPTVLPEGLKSNPLSPAEKVFLSGLPGNEPALPDAPASEKFPTGKMAADSLPGEKGRVAAADSQPRQNSESGEAFWTDLKNSQNADPAKFGGEIAGREEDPSLGERKGLESSAPGISKSGEPSANLVAPPETSAGLRHAAEARPESAQGLNPPPKAAVPEQISQKMVWSLGQQEEKIRLSLDPPQLGSIYMEIQRDKEQVRATLWADNPNTKQILESSQLSIQKIIETEGFSLESFDVFVEQDLSAFQESRERTQRDSKPATPGSATEVRAELGGGPGAPLLFARRGGAGLRSIDLIV
jgi:hypothetical protein